MPRINVSATAGSGPSAANSKIMNPVIKGFQKIAPIAAVPPSSMPNCTVFRSRPSMRRPVCTVVPRITITND